MVEKGQVYVLPLGSRVEVMTEPNERSRVDIRDEKSGSTVQVHVRFFEGGARLIAQKAQIVGEERPNDIHP